MSTIEKPEIKRSSLSNAKRIVIKVGSSLLTDLELGLNRGRIADYSAQIVELIDNDREVVLVSSGAIAEGCVRLGWSKSCLLYTSPSPRDRQKSRMPSSA